MLSIERFMILFIGFFRSRIVNLLQKGDLDGVLQIANRLNRVEQRLYLQKSKHPCPRDTLFQGSGPMENSFTGCLGKV